MTHKFLGQGIHESECEVVIYETSTGEYLIILRDLGIGTSVTNAAEQIATEVYNLRLKRKGLELENIVWLEHYKGKKNYDFLELVERKEQHYKAMYYGYKKDYLNERFPEGTIYLGPKPGVHLWAPCPEEMFKEMVSGAVDVTMRYM